MYITHWLLIRIHQKSFLRIGDVFEWSEFFLLMDSIQVYNYYAVGKVLNKIMEVCVARGDHIRRHGAFAGADSGY